MAALCDEPVHSLTTNRQSRRRRITVDHTTIDGDRVGQRVRANSPLVGVQKTTHRAMIRVHLLNFRRKQGGHPLAATARLTESHHGNINLPARNFHHAARTVGPDFERRVRRL
jgi:hypothetical protein